MKAGVGPGELFAGYRIESLVGRGGMGVVYHATDLSLERPVALKLIAPELAESEHFRTRFLREPRLAASLDHPNVIPIYEAGEHDGQLYLAMRFVEGTDLRSILSQEGRLAPERAIALVAQVGDALDAAHSHALVHRDVKPANVLLDRREHVYLTDFGITKQMGGDSTDTGRLVGTLDYLAPEQIRGDEVDGRTDVYALGCVLYACLAGAPPFRRETEAETMWAHMRDDPAPVPGHQALAPVFRKALAKDVDDRYGTCAELIDAAAGALGLSAPRPVRRPLEPSVLRRHGRRLVAGGLLIAAVVAGVMAVALTGGDDGEGGRLGNGIAALDPEDGEVTTFVESRIPPGNVAVGEGALWMLRNEDRRIARVDPGTGEVTRTFRTRGVPSELAVGERALWVAIAGGGDSANATIRVSRLDLDSGRVTNSVRLRGDEPVLPVAGTPRLAVGAGAVWAVNPDGSVSRIDPASGELEETIEVPDGAWTIAAGDEGVWFLPFDDPSAVGRIDPRTNRVTRPVRVGASELLGLAVGGGSVWAAAHTEGLVWRIEPGPPPVTRTIEVGTGASFVAFGGGSLWAGNYADGTVTRIDPETNSVASRTAVGSPQSLAAGVGGAWVSVAGGTTEGDLASPPCGEVVSAGGTPDVLIASDLPLRGPDSTGPRAMASAVRFAIERRGFKAGGHTVGYQSCDVSTPQTGGFELRKCAANATAYAHAKRVVAVIGPWSSFCGQVQIPILNRAPGGPLAMVSAASTHPGLTRGGPLALPGRVGIRGEPGVYYPTGQRSFMRVIPREDQQATAHAMLARELGLKRVIVVDERGSAWTEIYGDVFQRAAGRLGLEVAGSLSFDPDADSLEKLAAEVDRSGADGVFLAAELFTAGDRLLRALRAKVDRSTVLMATDRFLPIPVLLEMAGPAARGMYVSAVDAPSSVRRLSPAGRAFARDFGDLTAPEPFVIPAAQAADVVLRAIARSDGSRASVLEELRGMRVRGGILGDFRFDRYGDITPAEVPIFRVTGRAETGKPAFDLFEGAAFDRIVRVPSQP